MTKEELLEMVPEAGTQLEQGNITWDDLASAVRIFGGAVNETSQAVNDAGLEVLIPGTATDVKLAPAGVALLRMLLSAGPLLVPGPHTCLAWGAAAANFGDACVRLRNAINSLNVDNGELCVYLALGETGSAEDRSLDIYPDAAQVALTLESGGIEWCGLRCRFHRRHHDPVDNPNIEKILSFLAASPRSLVVRKSPSTWWLA